MKNKIKFLLFLSFLEGGSVMAAELLGAKMMAPFFGNSLYVWASVMAVTLFGLASGYFIGGIQSEKEKREKTLYRMLVLAGTFLILMPFIAKFGFLLFGKMNLSMAVTISSLLILFPPVFLMGMVSPLIISLISQSLNPGRASGTVYAISTIGGILATFAFGFFIIPSFGLTIPSVVTGILLGIIPLIKLFRAKDFNSGIFLILVASVGLYKIAQPKGEGLIKVVYVSEGVLGQIMVLDYPRGIYSGDSSKINIYSRWLFVNRISQTMDDPEALNEKNGERYFTYVYHIEKVLDTFPENRRKVLLLGLGGGSVASHLTELGYQVDVCELDSRMEYVARNYFQLPDKVKVTIDDARHFINNCDKKYDVIIFDTFKGEETPSHIFTMESLARVKEILNQNGLMIVNTFGFMEGDEGKGTRSIYKTLLESGMSAVAWPTDENVYERNIEFLASPDTKRKFVSEEFIYADKVNLDDAFILTDDYPRFEIVNAEASLLWRRMAIDVFSGDEQQRILPVFF